MNIHTQTLNVFCKVEKSNGDTVYYSNDSRSGKGNTMKAVKLSGRQGAEGTRDRVGTEAPGIFEGSKTIL